ncbi:MAG: insulinase family protein [Oscillospiraceae bacterium]|nr:insulinase family protein [Oscillospiraceae bacterium]
MYEKMTLPNGARLVYDRMPGVRSVSCNIWIGAGSRYEKPSENGASHFIEHMVFKGTGQRSAAALAEAMDAVGGQVNAFTAKDCTCFYGRVLDEHLPILTDLLCDMLFGSVFAEECVESERGVIFDEIDMYEDTPDDLVSERLCAAVYRGSSLARPVLGTKRTLSKLTGDSLKRFMAAHYGAENTVAALAGSFTDGDLADLAERLSSIPRTAPAAAGTPVYTPTFTVRRRPTEQNHLCLGFPGVSLADGDRFAARILCEALGGGYSSRLFQKLREEKGLCYAVNAGEAQFADCGFLELYAAVSRENEAEALSMMLDEVKRIADGGVRADELERVRGQARVSLLMSLESTGSRASRLGRSELLCGRAEDVKSLIDGFEAVGRDDVLRLARRFFTPESLSLSAVGRVQTADAYRELTARSF